MAPLRRRPRGEPDRLMDPDRTLAESTRTSHLAFGPMPMGKIPFARRWRSRRDMLEDGAGWLANASASRPGEIPGGHSVAPSRPAELADLLAGYA